LRLQDKIKNDKTLARKYITLKATYSQGAI